MVYYGLKITAELQNLTKLQPMGGTDDPDFTYYLKMKCGGCGELTEKAICVSVNDEVSIKCKFCERVGTVNVMSGRGHPLTQAHSEKGEYTRLIKFQCMGYDPVEFVFGTGWKAESVSPPHYLLPHIYEMKNSEIAGTVFEDIDLSEGEFSEYDEKGECPVMIYDLRSSFEFMMSDYDDRFVACKMRLEEWRRRWAEGHREEKKLNRFYN